MPLPLMESIVAWFSLDLATSVPDLHRDNGGITDAQWAVACWLAISFQSQSENDILELWE
jgi:hypothetical protein